MNEIDPRTIPVRYSNLKAIKRSPLHYWHAVQRGGLEETLSMRLGSGTHALILGKPEIVVYRGGTLLVEKVTKGKKGAPDTVTMVPKEYTAVRNGACWEAFEEANRGKLILSETELETATAMARALTSDMHADSLLFAPGTLHEHRIEWTMMGRRCSGTLDAIGPIALPDLKCTKDASPRWFPMQARQMAWHGQVAWYRDGAEAAGYGSKEPYLVAVENSAPFAVQVFRLTDADYQDGRRLYTEMLERLLECEAMNLWPSYLDGVADLNVFGRPVADEAEAA